MQLAVLQFERERPQQTKMQVQQGGIYDGSKRLQAIKGGKSMLAQVRQCSGSLQC